MQFFHLFSFVVVASYAAALPQPVGLSEKYSNNVDTNSASGLEARSYQPGLNSQKDSATLMSLKRRANSGSDPSPPSATTPEKKASVPFTDNDVDSMNLAFTIDSVQHGYYALLGDEKKVKRKMIDTFRVDVEMYLGRGTYVNAALNRWAENSIPGILLIIKSLLGEDEYSVIEKGLTERLKELEDGVRARTNAVADYISKIVEDDGSAVDNLERIHESLKDVFSSRMHILWIINDTIMNYKDGKTLYGYLDKAYESVDKFSTDQDTLYDDMMKEIEAASS
ncbi:hypothetical protein BASA50_007151 [Batrachochytrium salamandrivorans]|uniref:Uncharacterized protein n=1 Tax=Batrachochytrium salamandrivorans TaxID=1357716 RepID=A0ABQ8FAP2_9FUNG|nr:hypothetical protein BASA60_003745 [Batrachochytrium salamandrivorans]KAH6585367.1 hypothetical protein BASA61_006888 [Batrachochytrium salamandrivorans]KAH6593715.1 hypothetical protein BASA50_007151 [Batrachochytrium salamandrivorans]